MSKQAIFDKFIYEELCRGLLASPLRIKIN